MGSDNCTGMVSAQTIKAMALRYGFDACGVAPVHRLDGIGFGLREWIDCGFHAGMAYMARNVDMRHDPRLLLPGAMSVISVLRAYKSDYTMKSAPRIAQYAFADDYHDTMKASLYALLAAIRKEYSDFQARVFVDTAPISDKLWAREAGLGWIGKNTLLVNPQYGSLCFVGEIVTTAVVDRYDTAVDDGCAACKRCVEACPNKAIVQMPSSGRFCVDARRCTSYNTIENRAESLPDSLRVSGYAFGCDICQSVCPYNVDAPASVHVTEKRRIELERFSALSEEEFGKATRHTAMSRIGYMQWRRNIDCAVDGNAI